MFDSALPYFLKLLLTCVVACTPVPEPPAFAEALSSPVPWTVLTGCAHRYLTSLDWFPASPPDLVISYTDSTMRKRCAGERIGTSPMPFSMTTALFLSLHSFVSRRLPRIKYPTTRHRPDTLDGIEHVLRGCPHFSAMARVASPAAIRRKRHAGKLAPLSGM